MSEETLNSDIIDEKVIDDTIRIDLINDENFESHTDDLSNNVKKKVIKSVELNEKAIEFKNCEIKKLNLKNCNVEVILHSKITEMSFTKIDSYENKCNIKSLLSSQFGKVSIEKVDFEDSDFTDCEFENDLSITKSNTKYTDEDSKDNTKYYGLRIIRCSGKGTFVLSNINGTLSVQDTESNKLEVLSSPLDRLTILRCIGEILEISDKDKIKDLRIINSKFENDKSYIIPSDDETITKIFPNVYTDDFQSTDTIITDAYIPKIIVNKDNIKPLKLKHCFIKELIFEEENIISIPIQIIDSVIENITVESESFTRKVDFTGTVFKCSFHLKEIKFDKFLLMQETTFVKEVRIKKISIQSDLNFTSSRFVEDFFFSENNINVYFIIDNSLVEKEFAFRESNVGYQLAARKVKFKDETMFSQNKIADHVYFDDSEMEKNFTFNYSDLRGQLLARKVKFKNEAMFRSNKIADIVFFDESEIEKKFTFELSDFGLQLLARKVKFKDEAMFSGNKIADHVYFDDSEMEKKFTFKYSDLGGQLIARKVKFKDEAIFSQNKIADIVRFDDSEMEKKFTFKYSDLGGQLLAEKVKFKDEAMFSQNEIAGSVRFDDSEMEKKFTFEISNLGKQLSSSKVKFKDEAMFSDNNIANPVFFDDSEMEKKFTFKKSNLGGPLLARKVKFTDETMFSDNEIANDVYFYDSEMEKKFTFQFSGLGGQLLAMKVKFKDEAIFIGNKIADDVRFDDSEMEKKFTFKKSNLEKQLSARKVKFKDETMFSNNKIADDVYFEDSDFLDSLFIFISELKGKLLLNNISVTNRIEFYSNFIKEINIHNPVFLTTLLLYQNEISNFSFKNLSLEYLDFSNNIIKGNAFFGERNISQDGKNTSTKFLGISDFEETRFYGKTIFNYCTFNKLAHYVKTQFFDDVHFDYCTFYDRLDLSGCFVQNSISFNGAKFEMFVNLYSFLLDKKLTFLDSEFNEKTSSINLSAGSYSDISLSKEQLMEYHNTSGIFNIFTNKEKPKIFYEGILHNYRNFDVCLLNIEIISDEFISKIIVKHNVLKELNEISFIDKLSEVHPAQKELRENHYNRFEQHKKFQIVTHYLQNADNKEIIANIENKELVINENYGINNMISKEKICDEVIDNYLILKDNFGKSGNHIDEDWAYYNLMHYKNMKEIYHQRASNSKFKLIAEVPAQLKWLIFEKAFGWGVKLFNLLFTSIFVIFFFGGLYWLLGKIDLEASLNFDGGIMILDKTDFGGSVYLSLQSFISVLIGNLSPINSSLLKGLITVESMIGILIMTFLVGAYTRKILR